MRHWILEGTDGSGKSTLARLIAGADNNYDARHVRKKPSGERPLSYYLGMLLDKRPTIFDRFYLSERVYAPLLRGLITITRAELKILTDVTMNEGIPVVVCLPPVEVCIQNVFSEGRPRPAYQTEQFIRDSYRAFEDVTLDCATHVFNYHEETAEAFLKRIGVPVIGRENDLTV